MKGIKYARDARKRIIEELGMSAHSSFIEVANKAIIDKRLYADMPKSREEAIAFLIAFHWKSMYSTVRPIPDGITREQLGLQ